MIGAIVGDGLSADELHAEFERSHLRLLNSLTDRDVEVLSGKVHFNPFGSRQAVEPESYEVQQLNRAIYVMAENHLLSLGLIATPIGLEHRPRLGIGPPITHVKHHQPVVTPLGRSLILRLDGAATPVPESVKAPASEKLVPDPSATAKGRGAGKARRRV